MKKLILLWFAVFTLSTISIAYTHIFVISPIWVINIVAAYYLVQFRKQIGHPLFSFIFSFSAIFIASYFFDHTKTLKFKAFLSFISAVQVLSFVYIYPWIRLKSFKSRYFHTAVITVPNVLSAFIGGILFMLLFDLGENYYEFLDYFLEQFSTCISVMCILYGLQQWKKIPISDYALIALALLLQYLISTDPIFYACFIFPFFMCYFSIKHNFKEICLLLGLLTFICGLYISIPLAGKYWTDEQVHMLSRISSYRLALGFYLIIFLFMSEIYSKNRRLNDAYERMMFSDDLTGLKNRRYVREKVLTNPTFKDGYVLLLDIDDFKKVNDVYGHHIGDLVIKHMSGILNRAQVKNKVISRWGGEEFLVVIPRGSSEECVRFCDEILEGCRHHPFVEKDVRIDVTVSIGAMNFSNFDMGSYETLIQQVDKCLYEAKAAGKKQYVYGGVL